MIRRAGMQPLRSLSIGLIVAAASLSIAAPCRAQDVSVSLRADQQQIALGDAVDLYVAINGTQDATPPSIELPDAIVRYVGPSTYVSIVNGRMTSSVTFRYTVLPKKAGTLSIGPVAVRAGGQQLQTEPVNVDVLPASSRPTLPPTAQGSPSTSGGIDSSQRASLEQAIQLQIATDKRRAYVQEAIPIKLQLVVAGVPLREIEMPKLAADGFLVKPLGQPQQSEVTIDGQPHTLLEFDTTAVPIRPGTLQLGPATIDCQILVRRRLRSPRNSSGDPLDSFLGMDSVFEDFFGQGQLVPVTIEAKPVAVEVLPLPDAGRPATFDGAVGQFALEASAVPTEAAVGEPITLTMTIRGEGNFDTVSAPRLVGSTGAFKVYSAKLRQDPQQQSSKSAPSQKVFEQVLIPIDASATQLPAIELTAFNPTTGAYEMLRHEPIPVRIRPAPAGAPTPTVIDTAPPAGGKPLPSQEAFGHDLVYIKEAPGRFVPADWETRAGRGWIWWGLGPLAAVLISEALRRLLERRRADPGVARATGALKRAMAQLDTARRLMQDRPAECYAQVFRAVQRYVGDRLNVPSDGLTKTEIVASLRSRSAPEDAMEQLAEVFERCDAARFAPSSVSAEMADATLREAEAALKRLEQWRPA